MWFATILLISYGFGVVSLYEMITKYFEVDTFSNLGLFIWLVTFITAAVPLGVIKDKWDK